MDITLQIYKNTRKLMEKIKRMCVIPFPFMAKVRN